MDGRIQYLNTDLDLKSTADLRSLAGVFESQGIFPLHVTLGEDGRWHSIFETERSFDEPGANIAAMLDVIESISSEHTTIWWGCELKEFNIGYDCGDEPWAFNQGLSSEILARMAAVGASLRWTIYPDRRDADEQSSLPAMKEE